MKRLDFLSDAARYSHLNLELGGDRVALSKDLKDTLLRNGRIEPYRRTYAKRLPKVITQPVTQPVEPMGHAGSTRLSG